MRARQRTGTGAGGGGGIETQAPFTSAAFKLPLKNTLVPAGGNGPATFTRATEATFFDNEGILKTARSGAARFTGARRVANLMTESEQVTGTSWPSIFDLTITNGVSGPLGGLNGTRLTSLGTNGYMQSSLITTSVGRVFRMSFWARNTGVNPSSVLRMSFLASGSLIAASDLQTSTVPSTWTQYSILGTIPSGATDVRARFGGSSVFSTGMELEIALLQIEDVTGQSDQTASEYVSVGVLSTPWHGAGVDGVKYFATNKDGTTIPDTYLKGYLTEGARTNNLLYCRDLTNAAWVKSNTSAAINGNGIAGGTNTCSTLTATAGNGTCLQTITLAAASRTFSVYVKRRTGTGTISLTRDGGTSWTDVTASLNTSGYTRVFVENTSVTNPSCGFRITTSGDAIDVDYCQDEAGAYASNPITTDGTAVTRNQDVLSYPVSGNMSLASGTSYLNFGIMERALTSSAKSQVLCVDIDGRCAYQNPGFVNTDVAAYDGTTGKRSNPDGLSRAGNILRKCSSRWGADLAIISSGNSSISTGSFDGSLGSSSSFYVGSRDGNSTDCHFGNFRDIYLWTSELTDTQMKQIVRG